MNERCTALVVLLLVGCQVPSATDAGASDAGARDAYASDASANVVALETADEASLARLADLAGLPIPSGDRLAQAASDDRGGGPPYVSTLFDRGNRDTNYFVCLGQGSDVREPNLEPIRYDLPACPETYVRGAVLARFEGSGAMVRLWATLFSARSTPPVRERLRIYVDDEPTPVVDVSLAAAMDGTASPIFAPPFGAAAADHLAWYYPVVFARRLVVALDGLGPADLVWHQTDVRLDASPVDRHRAPDVLPGRATAAASLAAPATGTVRTFTGTIAPGASVDALVLPGAGTIRELALRAASRDALEGLAIAIRWDGATTPAIDVPLLDLFAASLDAPTDDARAPIHARTDASGLRLALALPMAFASGARITLTSAATLDRSVTLEALLDDATPPAAALRLHVEPHETLAPATTSSHPLAHASGRGVFAGACAMMEGHALDGAMSLGSPLNFLEGDERIVLDGAHELRGTGTEDFFDGAFYFEGGASAGPFAQGAANASTSPARASGCRWYVRTNALDFATALDASLEIGPGDASLLERYRSVAFVYE